MHYALPNWVMTMPRLRGGHGCMHMKVRDLAAVKGVTHLDDVSVSAREP